MRRSVAYAIGIFAILSSCSRAPEPQTNPVPDGCTLPVDTTRRSIVTTSRPSPGDSVRRGELAGTIVDAESGKPLQAQVLMPASNRGLLSDSAGHFRIPVARDGARVFVRRVGYVGAEIPTAGVGESGLTALVRLPLAPVGLCTVRTSRTARVQ